MSNRGIQGTNVFNSSNGAELFPGRTRKHNGGSGYRRFGSAADAVRFAIEELPASLLLGAYLEIDETRFDMAGIRALYDSADYPFARAEKIDVVMETAGPESRARGAIPPSPQHARG
jgi:hypothetical protein